MTGAVYIGRNGPVAPGLRVDRRWPLVGTVGALAWRFDGRRVVMRLVRRPDAVAEQWRGRRGIVPP